MNTLAHRVRFHNARGALSSAVHAVIAAEGADLRGRLTLCKCPLHGDNWSDAGESPTTCKNCLRAPHLRGVPHVG